MRTSVAFWLAWICDTCKYDTVSEDLDVQLSYVKMRLNGESHRMADMLAHCAFPGIRGTDSDFMKGSHIQDSILDGVRHRMAQASGVDTNGKKYLAGLARFPGDPEAWVSGTSDVLRICSNRGWNCHGAVEYEAPDSYPVVEADKPKDCPIAPDILQEQVAARLSEYDPREVTPRLAEDIADHEMRRLSGEIDTTSHLQRNIEDYTYEQSVSISEGD